MKFIKIIIFSLFCINIVTNTTFAAEMEQSEVEYSPVELNIEKTEGEEEFTGNVAESDPDTRAEENAKIIELKVENNHFFKDVKLNGAVQAFLNYNQPMHGSNSYNFSFHDTHLWVTGKALNENTNFKVMFNPLRDVDGYHGVKTIFSDVYVQTKHQRIQNCLLVKAAPP